MAEQSEFVERQQFRQPWLWALMGLTLLIDVAIFVPGSYQQLVLGRPWGDRPMSDTGLVITALSSIGVFALILLLFWKAQLVTRVSGDTLTVRFWPFHWRVQSIDLSRVTAVEAREYSPIMQYGGWGIRYGLKGKAYNVSGNRGVLLTYDDGKTLLIGSQRDEDLAAAIEAARSQRVGSSRPVS